MPSLLSHTAVPFLRLLIPLSCGILFQDVVNLSRWWPFLLTGAIIAIFLSLYPFPAPLRYRFRFSFGIGSSLLLFTIGILLMRSHQENPIALEQKPCQVSLMVEREPIRKNRTYQLAAQLQQIRFLPDTLVSEKTISQEILSKEVITAGKNVFLYIPIDSLHAPLHPGSLITGNGVINSIQNNGNPDEFDYRRYLRHQEIYYSIYLPTLQIDSTSSKKFFSSFYFLQRSALNQRQKLLEMLHPMITEPNAFAFASAILLGYRDTISDTLREEFSQTGLSHILAVSGLHTGIIFLLVMILFWPFRLLRLQKLVYLLVMLTMWGYAYLTSLSASVVRAVFMISILLVGKILRERSQPLNTLFITAFIMLLIQPHYLFDVGFQLSFMAVLSILIFQPAISGCINTNNPILQWGWNLLSVTLAAQILALPLSIYYFHTFPIWFMLSNLIILPLLPFYLFFLLVGLILALFGITPGFISTFLTFCTNGILSIIHGFSQLPSPVATNTLVITPWMLFMLFSLITLSTLFFVQKKVYYLIGSLFILLIGIISYPFLQPPTHSEIIIFNQNKSNSIHLFQAKEQWIYSPDTLFEEEKIRFTYTNYCLKRHIRKTHVFQNDTLLAPNASFRYPFIHIQGKSFCLITDNRFRRFQAPYQPTVDYLLVGGRYWGTLEKLKELCSFKKVVLLPTLSSYIKQTLMEEIQQENIPFYDIKKEGAFRVPLIP